MKGKLITFEGCEGCGKSTQVRLLKEYLEKTRQPFIVAREPGGTDISEKIRSVILDKQNSEMVDECEALLYAASRCQLLKQKILPALSEGKIVIIDRYYDSSFAYQAYARGLGYEFVASANKFAIDNAVPDLTIFFDIDPYSAFSRKGGADGWDRLELAGIDFHNKVYQGYKKLIEKFPCRIVAVDAHGDAQTVQDSVLRLLKGKGYIQ